MNTTAATHASKVIFKKLDDGSWGILSSNHLPTGSKVTVTRKDGSTTEVFTGALVTTIPTGTTITYRVYRIGKTSSPCPLDHGDHRCVGCPRHYFGLGKGGYAGD